MPDTSASLTTTEQRLSSFLDQVDLDKAQGFTLEKLYGAITTVADALHEHKLECNRLRVDSDETERSTNRRLKALEGGHSVRPPPAREASVPPMRDPAESIAEVRQLGATIANALKEGAELQGTTPEKKLEEVIEAQIKKKELQAELESAQAALAVSEQTRKDRRKLLASAGVTLGVAVLLRALEVLSRGHW